MKLRDLSQLYFLRREIQEDERRLRRLEQEVYAPGQCAIAACQERPPRAGAP